MAGEGRVGSRDEVGKSCGAKVDAYGERCKRVVLGPSAEFGMIDDTRQKAHGFIGIVYNNLSAGKTMISFITNSRRSCPGGAESTHALSKITLYMYLLRNDDTKTCKATFKPQADIILCTY